MASLSGGENGELFVRSLRTKDLEEARRSLREQGTSRFLRKSANSSCCEIHLFPMGKEEDTSGTACANQAILQSHSYHFEEVSRKDGRSITTLTEKPTLVEALDKHDNQLLYNKRGTLKMIASGRQAILHHLWPSKRQLVVKTFCTQP